MPYILRGLIWCALANHPMRPRMELGAQGRRTYVYAVRCPRRTRLRVLAETVERCAGQLAIDRVPEPKNIRPEQLPSALELLIGQVLVGNSDDNVRLIWHPPARPAEIEMPGEPSYLPVGSVVRLTEADQLPGYRPIWMRVHHIPLTFQRHRETGRPWTWVKGRQLANDGTPLHEPHPADPVLCAVCDPPAKWPCPPAKARMMVDYAGNRHGLCVYLARHLGATSGADPVETPRDTYDRIIAWTWQPDLVAVFGR